jgi:hypothetical protein
MNYLAPHLQICGFVVCIHNSSQKSSGLLRRYYWRETGREVHSLHGQWTLDSLHGQWYPPCNQYSYIVILTNFTFTSAHLSLISAVDTSRVGELLDELFMSQLLTGYIQTQHPNILSQTARFIACPHYIPHVLQQFNNI